MVLAKLFVHMFDNVALGRLKSHDCSIIAPSSSRSRRLRMFTKAASLLLCPSAWDIVG